MSLSWIPKGILNIIQRSCCSYLWCRSKGGQTFAWVKWDKIALPNKWGGWGIKNLYYFSQALETNVGRRLNTTQSLWTQVVTKKDIYPLSTEEWIRLQNKHRPNTSTIWKEILKSFHIIASSLAWRIGSRNRIRIRIDPWS